MPILEIQTLAGNVRTAAKALEIANRRVEECTAALDRAEEERGNAAKRLRAAEMKLVEEAKASRDPYEHMRQAAT
ncbi:hypothetical protein [Dyella sp. 2RAB6]|uniref:hypothetical protein n=1 Tax=Dyella sp. 2RAB6 TaxID=3232992 RepID=UPI003F92A6C9